MASLVESAIQSAEEMRAHLTAKACDDIEFRNQLIADPKGTFSQEFGIDVPDNINIQVHESDLHTLHLALPAGPELTEEQLEAVAAGLCCCL